MFLLDVGKKGSVAVVGFRAGTDELAILELLLGRHNHFNNYFGFY